MLKDNSTPAVVLGCLGHGELGIVRSLGRLGVPVYGVHADWRAPALFSKYCRRKFYWDVHGASEPDTAEFLIEVGREIGRRSVLIPTSDIGAMLVLEHADRLREWFLFPDPDVTLVRSLCSKREMYHLARAHGVPVPETSFPKSRSDVLEYLAKAKFPVILKPIYSGLIARAVKPMLLVKSAQELLKHYDAIEDPSCPNLMLQEFIPGGDETWVFNGYFDKEGECRLAFTGKKLRNYPTPFGQASLGMCLRNEEVEKTTIRFMKAIGYKGAVDVGYRYDDRDSRYKVNDINPRVCAMLRCFVGQNGMDVVRAVYQDMTEQSVMSAWARNGRKWIVEDRDLRSAFWHYREGRLSFKQWRESLRGVEETSYISLDDPGPILGRLLRAGGIRGQVPGRLARLGVQARQDG